MANIKLNSDITAELKCGGSFYDLGGAFKSVSQSMGENVYTAFYLSGGGFSHSAVTGQNFTVTFRGDYVSGDPVIDYIFSPNVLRATGSGRNTQLRIQSGSNIVTWNVAMTKIAETGGSAEEPAAVTLELRGVGAPN
ncbi:MAG: hypothetical protein LBN40_05695 [Oscillospiraceae bacterium]|nr:hypothetical protein [Oscillospiraceae bacterium]